MTLISSPRTGRHLMVLADAQTIAEQRRRRAAVARRRREAAAAVAAVALLIALLIGVSVQTLVLGAIALFVVANFAWHRLVEWTEAQRRRTVRARVGQGIGAPRPKGGFSTTRRRSGPPVWVDRRAA